MKNQYGLFCVWTHLRYKPLSVALEIESILHQINGGIYKLCKVRLTNKILTTVNQILLKFALIAYANDTR